ncbi:VOC family protein [Asanoa sp. WMMD1127]|uniref:VOC family protein n=1 Tax=Asanoa sp. WMMD1127 TaxID=3016107 RepID=UPI002415A48B|nr:VOC family protein [Asanoa sp. WMMD1127]MDG4824663.1 VOC family protein [Asanoa sp. WMMD1127]
MSIAVTTIMLGVQDLDRAKKFYTSGLGATVKQDYPGFVHLDLGAGSSSLALYDRAAAAAEVGMSPEGTGFRAVSFHHIVSSRAEVDEVMAAAEAAGAEVVKAAVAAEWGGYDAWFADPDGHLWKVATAS